jgi:hypothetical protein
MRRLVLTVCLVACLGSPAWSEKQHDVGPFRSRFGRE